MVSIIGGETGGLDHGCDEVVREWLAEAADARAR
jgi:hypothetical protein